MLVNPSIRKSLEPEATPLGIINKTERLGESPVTSKTQSTKSSRKPRNEDLKNSKDNSVNSENEKQDQNLEVYSHQSSNHSVLAYYLDDQIVLENNTPILVPAPLLHLTEDQIRERILNEIRPVIIQYITPETKNRQDLLPKILNPYTFREVNQVIWEEIENIEEVQRNLYHKFPLSLADRAVSQEIDQSIKLIFNLIDKLGQIQVPIPTANQNKPETPSTTSLSSGLPLVQAKPPSEIPLTSKETQIQIKEATSPLYRQTVETWLSQTNQQSSNPEDSSSSIRSPRTSMEIRPLIDPGWYQSTSTSTHMDSQTRPRRSDTPYPYLKEQPLYGSKITSPITHSPEQISPHGQTSPRVWNNPSPLSSRHMKLNRSYNDSDNEADISRSISPSLQSWHHKQDLQQTILLLVL